MDWRRFKTNTICSFQQNYLAWQVTDRRLCNFTLFTTAIHFRWKKNVDCEKNEILKRILGIVSVLPMRLYQSRLQVHADSAEWKLIIVFFFFRLLFDWSRCEMTTKWDKGRKLSIWVRIHARIHCFVLHFVHCKCKQKQPGHGMTMWNANNVKTVRLSQHLLVLYLWFPLSKYNWFG